MSSKILEGKVKILILVTACLFIGASSFKVGDPVRIMVNKISPYTNPTESYLYYDLPFCRPENPTRESQSFGERLTGNRKMSSLYQATFGSIMKKTSICEVELSVEQLGKFRSAIKQNYLFEMFIEDAVAGNSIGYVKNNRIYLATHLNFNIFYNKATGNIIKAQIDYDDLYHTVDITDPNTPLSINFSYAVNWGETVYTSPLGNNGNDTSFASEPHWLAFFNGISINTLLFVIIWSIFQKIQKVSDPNIPHPDTEAEKKDADSNWKAIRGEVFRAPVFRILLCSGVGSGVQLALTTLIVLLLGALGMFYNTKGSFLSAAAFVYLGTSVISGITSSSLFRYLGGKTWTANLIATFLCFPAPLIIIATVLNNIAWIDQSTSALPFGTVIILLIFLVIALPLTVLGGVTGRKREKEKLLEADDKAATASSFFSLKPSHIFMVAIAGLFSFSVLYFELHSVFAAVWARKIYTSYGSLLLTVILAINVAASISIIFTYCQLNNRDCKWWWRSFFYGGSCGLYVFLYAVYFYFKKSQISGFMQTCFYFGYSTLGAFAVFLVLGTAGFVGASAFVKQIYERRKVD